MTLQPGQMLSHYRLVEKIGEGGMGVVWKAFDNTLGREVAIKLLPEDVARSPERTGHFEREARLLAALNHPHIATVHGFEQVDDTPFLVLELVGGEALDERIAQGPLPVAEVLDIGRQIALGLEAAHDKGIVHRDLKPGNVKLTGDGIVKVLDFGLAKAMQPPAGVSPSQSPTVTAGGTRTGTIFGTPAYMSPEQARGRPLDRRTDIWSFGCILYECLTGKGPFFAENVGDTIARILEHDPDWKALPVATPGGLRRLIERCLRKDDRRRLRDIGDARMQLAELQSASTSGSLSPQNAHPAPGSSSRTSVAVPLKLPSRPSLAVLPFENVGDDPEQEYFALGLWTDINADLVKIAGLFLVSPLSTGFYKEKAASPQQVGRELGVRHILQGTVRRSGDRVRMTTQLVDTRTGEPIWAERYDGRLHDLFALQDRINEEIIAALDIKLVRGEGHRIIGRSLRDPKARDIYYRALAALFSLRREETAEALGLLSEVETLEPGSPLSHAFVAFGLYFEATLGFRDSPENALDEAMARAERAIELDDPTGTGHMIQGMIQLRRRQHDAALASSEKAMRDRPSCTWAYALQGAVHNYAGRPAISIDLARLAIRHSPLVPPVFPAVLATAHYLLGQHEEAVDAARSTLRLAPETLEANVVLAAALAAAGRATEAGPVVKEIYRINAGFTIDDFAETQPYKDPDALGGLLADLRAVGVS